MIILTVIFTEREAIKEKLAAIERQKYQLDEMSFKLLDRLRELDDQDAVSSSTQELSNDSSQISEPQAEENKALEDTKIDVSTLSHTKIVDEMISYMQQRDDNEPISINEILTTLFGKDQITDQLKTDVHFAFTNNKDIIKLRRGFYKLKG